MSDDKTTPGPWALRGYQIRAGNGLGQHIATVQTSTVDGHRLAAAQDLYAGCVAFVEAAGPVWPDVDTMPAQWRDAFIACRDAIEKARQTR
jgi:hypothetical protein